VHAPLLKLGAQHQRPVTHWILNLNSLERKHRTFDPLHREELLKTIYP
jgi:hypothetical protein